MPRCSQQTVAGERCRAYAVHGSDRCVSHLGRTGPASGLTPALGDQLVTLLSAGNYIGTAAATVGISRRTFDHWMQRGRSEAPQDAAYRELRERVERARAEGEALNVAAIAREARGGNWQAAAWMLERQWPERWARPSQREHYIDRLSDVPVRPEDDPFSELDELAAARRRREREPLGS